MPLWKKENQSGVVDRLLSLFFIGCELKSRCIFALIIQAEGLTTLELPNAEAQPPPECAKRTEGTQSTTVLWAVGCSALLAKGNRCQPIVDAANDLPKPCRSHHDKADIFVDKRDKKLTTNVDQILHTIVTWFMDNRILKL